MAGGFAFATDGNAYGAGSADCVCRNAASSTRGAANDRGARDRILSLRCGRDHAHSTIGLASVAIRYSDSCGALFGRGAEVGLGGDRPDLVYSSRGTRNRQDPKPSVAVGGLPCEEGTGIWA